MICYFPIILLGIACTAICYGIWQVFDNYEWRTHKINSPAQMAARKREFLKPERVQIVESWVYFESGGLKYLIRK
jgi:hypothetical protein